MKRSERTIRYIAYLVFVLMISAALAACGGGGGGSSTSPGTSGPATVRVSIASAPSYPAGTTFATSTSSPTTEAPPENSPNFDNVFVTVTKLALIPSTGPEFPDPNGELESSSADGGKGFVTAALASPVEIDLKNLSGDNVATLLNTFSGVPVGEYSKIRVYYDNVVGQPGNVLFHQTANYHFDVHFVGGNLVIPVASDPEGGIQFFSVVIDVVGLKITSAGNSGNILMRPQVFAKVVGDLEYIVSGVADNVTPINSDLNGTFDILTLGGRSIPTAFSGTGTSWANSDNVLNGSQWVHNLDKTTAVHSFFNRAEVSAIGTFDTEGRLQASRITFTFPDVRGGTADNVWIYDNTAFIVRSSDNVTVYPQPDRSGAYYDNSTSPFPPLTFDAIKNGIQVKARGYFNPYPGLDLDAYWISIGP